MVRILALFLSVCFGLAAQTVNINVPATNSKGNQVSVGGDEDSRLYVRELLA